MTVKEIIFDNWVMCEYNENIQNDDPKYSLVTEKIADLISKMYEASCKLSIIAQGFLVLPIAITSGLLRVAERIGRVFEFVIQSIIYLCKNEKENAYIAIKEAGIEALFLPLAPLEFLFHVPTFTVCQIQILTDQPRTEIYEAPYWYDQ